MSNFYATAVNPRTGHIEQAEFLDDWFGEERYGVRFNDGYPVYPENQVVIFSNWHISSYGWECYYQNHRGTFIVEMVDGKPLYEGTVEDEDALEIFGYSLEEILADFKKVVDRCIKDS